MLALNVFYLVLFTLHTTPSLVYGNYTRTRLEELLADKRYKYNKLVMDVTKGMTVRFGFELVTLRYIHEVEEMMSVVGSMDLSWTDQRLAWNMSEYDGIESIMVENGLFWTPLVIHGNSFEKIEKVGNEEYWPLRIYHTGTVFYFLAQIFTSTCSIDITMFPLDRQTCTLQFLVYGYQPDELTLVPNTPEVVKENFHENVAWKLEGTSLTPTFGGVAVDVTLTFSRRSTVIIINVILPVICLSVLNCLAFLIPADSGEKISYSMTILLAITVFLTLVSDHMPQSGERVAILCYYLAAVMCMGVCIMIGTVISVRIAHRSSHQVIGSAWLLLVKCTCTNTISNTTPNPGQVDQNEQIVPKSDDRDVHGEQRKILTSSAIKYIHNIHDGEKSFVRNSSDSDISWKNVSFALDRLQFYLSLTISIVFVCLYMGYIVIQKD